MNRCRTMNLVGALALLLAAIPSARAQEEDVLAPEALARFNAMSLEDLLALAVWNISTPPQNVDFSAGFVPSTYTFPTTVTSTLGHEIRWPYTLGLNLECRVRSDLESFLTFSNITNHHYANVYDSTGYPAETVSVLLGLRYKR